MEPQIKSQLEEQITKEINQTVKERLLFNLWRLRNDNDPESAHIKADKLLLEYIHDEEITKAFEEIDKYYA